MKHTGAILDFDNGKGCLYDPQSILANSKNSLNGDGVIYMIFELGALSPNESKSFTFSYYLNDKLEQLIGDITDQDIKITPEDGLHFSVERSDKETYQLIEAQMLTVGSNAPGITKRRFSFQYDKKSLPDGIELMVNDRALAQGEKKFRYNRKIPINLTRNSSYQAEEPTSIVINTLDTQCHQKSSFSITIAPKKRNVSLSIEKPPPTVLDTFDQLAPVSVKVLVNGKEVSTQVFNDFEIESYCDGIECRIEKDTNNNQFLLYLKPKKILAFTAVGEVPIELELTQGTFEDDEAKGSTTVYVEDIGFKKWIEPLVWLLLLLLLLWYLYGITLGKKRFKKNQVVSYEELVRGKRDPNSTREYYLRKEVGFFDMLIPYKAQEVRIQDIIFRAELNRRVYLSKKSQEYMKYNGRDVDEAGKKHLRLDGGDTLKTDYAIYTIL